MNRDIFTELSMCSEILTNVVERMEKEKEAEKQILIYGYSLSDCPNELLEKYISSHAEARSTNIIANNQALTAEIELQRRLNAGIKIVKV